MKKSKIDNMCTVDSILKARAKSQLKSIVPKLSRAELYENPRAFLKGVRATLLALGYDESFIEGEFREYLESFYEVSVTAVFL